MNTKKIISNVCYLVSIFALIGIVGYFFWVNWEDFITNTKLGAFSNLKYLVNASLTMPFWLTAKILDTRPVWNKAYWGLLIVFSLLVLLTPSSG